MFDFLILLELPTVTACLSVILIAYYMDCSSEASKFEERKVEF